MGAEISMNLMPEKLRETEREMGAEEWSNYVMEKLKEWLVVVENFLGSLIEKVDDAFPPETRGEQLKRWLQVATPFIIGAVVLITCLYCCSRCCCRGGGRAGRMMKAPGRNYSMPRSVFEENPRSYFRNHRANPNIDELV